MKFNKNKMFINETNDEKDIIEVQNMINMLHDKELVKPEESPNGNRIFHLYSDGSITNQKGGFAYLMRSEFMIEEPIGIKYKNVFVFPFKSGEYGYAIMTLLNAKIVREKMFYIYKNLNK